MKAVIIESLFWWTLTGSPTSFDMALTPKKERD